MLGPDYWRRQQFKLIYILCVMFVLPGVVIGVFALYLAIYEPGELRERLGKPRTGKVDPLENPSYFIRQDALKKLASETPDHSRRDIVEKVKKLVRDSNFQIQESAIDVLGKWGSAEDVPALFDLAKDQFGTFVRPHVCKALANIGGHEAVEALIDIQGMGSSEREHAYVALHKIGGDIEKAILERAEMADDAKLVVLLPALGEFGTEKSEELLEKAAGSENEQVAAAAKNAREAMRKRRK